MGTVKLVVQLAILVAFGSSVAFGQQQAEPAGQAPANATVSMADLRAELRSALQGLATKEELNSAVTDLGRIVNEQEAELRQLRQDFQTQQRLLDEQVRGQGEILRAISGEDSQGNRTLALRNIMSRSPDFRREVDAAVHDSMRKRGEVVIANHTANHQRVRINGSEVLLPPYTSSTRIPVDVGTVSTQLVGFEGPKYWTVAPPNYQVQLYVSDGAPTWSWPAPVAPLVFVRR